MPEVMAAEAKSRNLYISVAPEQALQNRWHKLCH